MFPGDIFRCAVSIAWPILALGIEQEDQRGTGDFTNSLECSLPFTLNNCFYLHRYKKDILCLLRLWNNDLAQCSCSNSCLFKNFNLSFSKPNYGLLSFILIKSDEMPIISCLFLILISKLVGTTTIFLASH